MSQLLNDPKSTLNGKNWMLYFLLFAALAYFLIRGPWRAIHDSSDFLTIFAAARCWVHGTNPYANADLIASARSAGANVGLSQFQLAPSVYLPPALLLMAPVGLLSWPLAKGLWLCVSLVSVALSGMALMRLWGGSSIWVWISLLAFAPLHTGLSKGQPSVTVCGMIIMSLAISNPFASGLLLGIAACIKPQLAIGFFVLTVFRSQRRTLITACITVLFISAAAMTHISPPIIDALRGNLAEISATGGMNSGSPLNPGRFQLLSVDTLIPAAMYNSWMVLIVSSFIIVITALAFVKAKTVDVKMLLSVAASATILIGYHRFYDAEILLLGIPFVLTLRPQLAIQRWVLLVLLLGYSVYLIPGQTMSSVLLKGNAGGPLTFLLLTHEVLACLIIWSISTGYVFVTAKRAHDIHAEDSPLRSKVAAQS